MNMSVLQIRGGVVTPEREFRACRVNVSEMPALNAAPVTYNINLNKAQVYKKYEK